MQRSIITEKLGYLTEKQKTLTSSNYRSLMVFAEIFANVPYLAMSTKECSVFFLPCLHLVVFG